MNTALANIWTEFFKTYRGNFFKKTFLKSSLSEEEQSCKASFALIFYAFRVNFLRVSTCRTTIALWMRIRKLFHYT